MRLLKLEIRNMRGIPELALSPEGENIVIWGPNGSGKSAVVDAVDFLLTGKISRLTGEGTGGVSLKAHGPHIDHKPEEAWVSAVVAIPGYKDPITLRRKVSSPLVLERPPAAGEALGPILTVAGKGQHVLSRREILRYVTAEAGKRANEVQTLLNLSEIEGLRKAFVKLVKEAKTAESSADLSIRNAKEVIARTVSIPAFALERVAEAVNTLRTVLGGEPLKKVSSKALKDGLTASPSTSVKPQIKSASLLREQLTALIKTLDGANVSVAVPDRDLREALQQIRENENALAELQKLNLLQLGVSMISEDGSCPLCGKAWEPGMLRRHIEEHIESARTTAERKQKIQALASDISVIVTACRSHVDVLGETALHLGLKIEAAQLGSWSRDLVSLTEMLLAPLQSYQASSCSADDVAGLFSSEALRETAENVVRAAEKAQPTISPEQAAWDTLTRLEENYRTYEESESLLQTKALVHKHAVAMSDCFEEARNHVLMSLYKSIESRFSELYRFIHQEDESKFEGSLRPDGAGLQFEVDFYGRGKFPPLALHSEGHQDTMGVCLYLALAERLTASLIDLTILDDVVMSVDAGHRRQICALLATKFPQRQFLITTHDRTWARQLVTTAVVPRKNSVEFTRWSVESGPQVVTEAMGNDFWTRIQKDIDLADIPAASARLRHGAEEYFEFLCDQLLATVQYRSDGRWELSDYASGAIGAYRKSLKEAKASAQSWKNKEAFEKLQELETVASQIIVRSQVEQWAINENVHYNRWSEFTPEDFQPVADAWRDLFNLFACSSCGGCLFLSDRKEPTSLRCKCGVINWNLVRKKVSATGEE